MGEKIPPALTPDPSWEYEPSDGERPVVSGDGSFDAPTVPWVWSVTARTHRAIQGGKVWESRDNGVTWAVIAEFTREDVEALRGAAGTSDSQWTSLAVDRGILRSLADRIEALLPPSDEKTKP